VPGEIPDNYFGVDLNRIEDPAVKQQTYEFLTNAEKAVNSRLRELAEQRKELEKEQARQSLAPQPAPEPQQLSDEELMQAVGMDPSVLQFEGIGPSMLAMAKRLYQAENSLEQVSQESQAERWVRNFYDEFNGLQSQYGDLPYSRADLEAYAADRQLFTPDALYWTLKGPLLQQYTSQKGGPAPAPTPERRTEKQQASSTVRRGSAPGTTTQQKPKTLLEAYEAAKAANPEAGELV
jgi:hypothetical protein